MKSISFRNSKKFFLSLTLLWIAPAFVQAGTLGQSTTYLSNLTESGGGIATGSDQYLTQPFVTGSDPRGYSLDFVKLNVGTSCSPINGNFQVFLYSDNAGAPGSSLGQLFGPNPSGAITALTYSTNGIGLSPNTTYWIVVNASAPKGDCNTAGFYDWQNTNSNTFTSSDGWSINTNAQGSGDGSNWGALPYRFVLAVNAQVKSHRKVALVASDDPSWVSAVQSKLITTGRFNVVDIIDAGSTTPSVAQLQAYDSVLVWADNGLAGATALGNNLADYVDAGGGVVVAVFANVTNGALVSGRFNSDDYWALEPTSAGAGTEYTLGTVYEAFSPLIAGVLSFDGGTASYRINGTPNANASRVADWSDGAPLIVRRTINGVRRTDLGFFPPSTDSRADFWVASTDGAKIMANALDFVGGTDCVPLPPNAIAWWRADGNANDSAGGHNGSLLGGVTFTSGEVAQAFSFDGANDLVYIADSAALNPASAITVDAWVRTDNGASQELVNKYDHNGEQSYALRIVDATHVQWLLNGPSPFGNMQANVPIADGNWHHLAATYDGATMAIYFDGALANSLGCSGDIAASNAPVIFGTGNNGGAFYSGFFSGELDEVEIFNRALTVTEIAKIYRAGSNGKCECTSAPANMISWWPAEGNADDIQDGNSGNISGGVSFATGEVNRGFDFDGATGFVDIGNPANLQLTSAITVDAWVRPDTTYGNYRTVISKWSQSANNSWGLFIANNTLYGYITAAGGGVSAAGGSIPFGPTASFSHVAMTYSNADGLRIYLDGAQVGASAGNGDINNGGDSVRIGNDTDLVPDRWFDGVIDEVEIFGRVLAADEISAIFGAGSAGKCRSCTPPPANMVSWWPGDDDANDIQDGNNGSLINGATFGPAEVGPGFSLDGANYVEVADSANLSITGPMTIDAWINTNDNTTEHAIVEKYDNPGLNGYFFRLNPGGQLRAGICNASGFSDVIGATQVSTGTFHHVAAVYDGTNLQVYLDGVLDGTATSVAPPTDGTEALEIGARGGGNPGNFFNGLIDEVEIFNGALNLSEIASIYDAGSGGKCKPAIPPQRQLANISARADVGSGDNVAIAGFIIQTDPNNTRSGGRAVVPTKHVLIRGLGPSLTSLGGAALVDPVLDLYNSQGNKIDHNDNWMEEPDGVNNPTRTSAIQATGLAPNDPNEAALLEDLISNSAYTAILSGKNGGTGIGLAEVYDLEATTSTHLHNLSTRAFVSTGDNVLIGGLIVQGDATTRILLRAIGPSLVGSGISNPLPDPVLQLFDANANLIETNDDWGSSPEAGDISASGLAPSDSKESSILFSPAPGPYTAIIHDKNNSSGIGLVEAYWLGP